MERSYEVTEAHDGARLDVFLTDALAGGGARWSRTRVQKRVRDAGAVVDGVRVDRPRDPVTAGQTVRFDPGEERRHSTDVSGRRIVDLHVLHEDDDVVVIDKPAGLIVHGNSRQRGGTVADLAVERYGPLPQVQGEDRPGIVHRLDRLTSGVLVLGRTEAALESLKAQFKARTVAKAYLAVVHNIPRFDTEWLTGAIEPNPKNPERMRVVHLEPEPESDEYGPLDPFAEPAEPRPNAKPAETYIERVEDFRGAALVAAHPKTGRTHQIRVHLQTAGLPIVGDRVYGPGGALRNPLPKGSPAMERPALHAQRLEFDHPISGERMAFEAEVPGDMRALIAALRDDAEAARGGAA